MWVRLESNTIKEILTRPKALTIGDINYPSNIFSMWTEAELAVIGIVPITMDYTNRKDNLWYINTAINYAYDTETGVATGSYGTATAKVLDNVLYTAQDETDGLGTEGEIKQHGLKPQKKQDINREAGNRLSETDWMVIREADGGTAMPSNIKTYRASVRTKANAMCTQIDNASDIDALAALYEYNSDDPPVRPLGELPTV